MIQLINKIGRDIIEDNDVQEATSICPTLALVIELCDRTMLMANVSAGLEVTMQKTSQILHDDKQEFEYNKYMNSISYDFRKIKENTEKFLLKNN